MRLTSMASKDRLALCWQMRERTNHICGEFKIAGVIRFCIVMVCG
ncbi:hypothetical protein SAMN05446934_9951 [Paraburkholderia hospita]|nr:hypothetical protein SAMN05446934_9951 [Paraburkholderia hospita]